MTGPAPHPSWCDLSRCGVVAGRPTGTHCSHVVRLGPHPPGIVVAEVSLAQGAPVRGYPRSGRPYVALALGEADSELCLAPLGIDLARELGRVLVGFARKVDG